MKFTLITFVLSTLIYYSSPKNRIIEKESFKLKTEDSLYIKSKFPIKMGSVSEAYFEEKKSKIDSFYNKFINSPYYSGGFIVVKNGANSE